MLSSLLKFSGVSRKVENLKFIELLTDYLLSEKLTDEWIIEIYRGIQLSFGTNETSKNIIISTAIFVGFFFECYKQNL